MEKFVWSPQMCLGVPAIDAEHKDFIEELERLSMASDEEFNASFAKLIARLEADFREEEMLMEEIDFPAIQNHREQHARVLSALHHVFPEVLNGVFDAARQVIDLVPHWFLFHLLTADTAMIAALQLAGKPIPVREAVQMDTEFTIPRPNRLC